MADTEDEARWRQLMHEHAMRMRILREEWDRENPPLTPTPLSRWDFWAPILTVIGITVGGAFLGWIISMPMHPLAVHIIQDHTP